VRSNATTANGSTASNGANGTTGNDIVNASTSDQSTLIVGSGTTDDNSVDLLSDAQTTLDGGGLQPWAIGVIIGALLLALLIIALVVFYLRRRNNDSNTSNGNNNDEMQSAREQASIGATPSTDYHNLSLAPAPPLTTTASEYAGATVSSATGTVARQYARAPSTGVYTKAPAAAHGEYAVASPLAPNGYGVVPPYGTVGAASDLGYGAAPPSVTGAGVNAYGAVDAGASVSSPYEAASARLES
jgi:hypothetical protein